MDWGLHSVRVGCIEPFAGDFFPVLYGVYDQSIYLFHPVILVNLIHRLNRNLVEIFDV